MRLDFAASTFWCLFIFFSYRRKGSSVIRQVGHQRKDPPGDDGSIAVDVISPSLTLVEGRGAT